MAGCCVQLPNKQERERREDVTLKCSVIQGHRIYKAKSGALKVKLFAAVVIGVKAFWSYCVPTVYSSGLFLGMLLAFVHKCRFITENA